MIDMFISSAHCNVNCLKSMQKLKKICLTLVTIQNMFLLFLAKYKSFEEKYGKSI